MEYTSELPAEGQKLQPSSFGTAAPALRLKIEGKNPGREGKNPVTVKKAGGEEVKMNPAD